MDTSVSSPIFTPPATHIDEDNTALVSRQDANDLVLPENSTMNPTEYVPVLTTPTSSHDSVLHDDSINQLGRGHRRKKQSTRLADFGVNTLSLIPLPLTAPPSSSSGTDHPLSGYYTCAQFSDNHRSYLVTLSLVVEPRSYKEAMKEKIWNDAMGLKLMRWN